MALPVFIRPHSTNNVKVEEIAELEAVPVVVHPAEVAARNFDERRAALMAYIEEHQKVFDDLDEYLSQYNMAVDNMHLHMKSGALPAGTYTGPFAAKKAAVSVSFDINKLPAAVKALPGVLVSSVDAKALSALVSSGRVKFEDVAAARTEETKAAAVTGPKKIELVIS